MLLGLYIHFPFCKERCPYCDFTSLAGAGPEEFGRYVKALKSELALRLDALKDLEISFETIFIGGGTPSLPDAEGLEDLLEIIEILKTEGLTMPRAEVTMEMNPESVDLEKAELMLEYGVSRASIGFQSLQDEELKSLGRIHDAQQAVQALTMLRMSGFNNVSLDLMYGIPGQTLDSWSDTLQQAALLAPEHMSAYALSLDPDKPAWPAEALPSEDEVYAMYMLAAQLLPAEGLAQYEISNWARPGMECRHNLRYWRREPYLGIGVSAAGFLGDERWTNRKDLEGYLSDVERGRLPKAELDKVSGEKAAREHLILNLRLAEGARFETFEKLFGLSVRELLNKEFVREELERFFVIRADSVSLNTEGFFLSDEVFRRLV